MPTLDIPAKYQFEARRAFLRDLRWRMAAGAFVYLFCWLLLLMPFNALLSQPIAGIHMAQGALLLLLAAMVRASGVWLYVHRALPGVSCDDATGSKYSFETRDLGLSLGLVVNALSWSVIMVLILNLDEFARLREPSLMICGVLYAFISVSLSIDLRQLRLFLICFPLPIGLAMAWQGQAHDILAGGLLMASAYPTYHFCRLHHQEYWRQLTARLQLKDYSEQLEHLSRTDSLTGLYNQRSFNEQLDKLSSRQPQALLLLDLDHFKRINDSFGHRAGDLCLAEVGRVIRAETQGLIAARYGGEEFAVLLSPVDTGQALGLAKSLRRKIEALSLVYKGQTFKVTVSIGLAYASEGSEPGALFHAADSALYAAKDAGRNCIREAGSGAAA
ncbi:diguanylate cyclase [Shewanella algae]|uniref:GGDEF domain-containing protein n=1 Tax=Shewanella algae TaxID=38313 RepID=UPI00313BF3AD